MRSIFLIGIIIMVSSCSFHSRQSQVEASKKEKAKEEKLAEQKAKESQDIAVLKELTPLERVLAKKISSKTFEQDMQIIENSEIYDQITCSSFRYSFELLQSTGQNNLDMTYKKALDRAKEGSDGAKRINKTSSYQLN